MRSKLVEHLGARRGGVRIGIARHERLARGARHLQVELDPGHRRELVLLAQEADRHADLFGVHQARLDHDIRRRLVRFWLASRALVRVERFLRRRVELGKLALQVGRELHERRVRLGIHGRHLALGIAQETHPDRAGLGAKEEVRARRLDRDAVRDARKACEHRRRLRRVAPAAEVLRADVREARRGHRALKGLEAKEALALLRALFLLAAPLLDKHVLALRRVLLEEARHGIGKVEHRL